MPVQRKKQLSLRDYFAYWWSVDTRAIEKTKSWFGWDRKTLLAGLASLVVGAGIFYWLRGVEAMANQVASFLAFTFAPLGVMAFLVFLWNVFVTPPQRQQETKDQVLTEKQETLAARQEVSRLRGQLDEFQRTKMANVRVARTYVAETETKEGVPGSIAVVEFINDPERAAPEAQIKMIRARIDFIGSDGNVLVSTAGVWREEMGRSLFSYNKNTTNLGIGDRRSLEVAIKIGDDGNAYGADPTVFASEDTEQMSAFRLPRSDLNVQITLDGIGFTYESSFKLCGAGRNGPLEIHEK